MILAAGGSTRMGRPKPLLPWRGTTLLRRVAEQALASRASVVAVVLGAGAQLARQELDGLPVEIVENERWQSGMGSSLQAGIGAIAAIPGPPPAPDAIDAAVILLVDQPLVDARTIDRLIEAWESSGRSLVACLHGAELGVPALFAATFFPELRRLTGDHGAREILRAHAAEVEALDLPEARIDVDTPGDWDALAGS